MRMCFNQLKACNWISPFTGLSVHIRPTHCFDFKLKTNEPSSAVVCQLLKRVNILLTLCPSLFSSASFFSFLSRLSPSTGATSTPMLAVLLCKAILALKWGIIFMHPSSTFHRLVVWVNNGCYRRVYRVQGASSLAVCLGMCIFIFSWKRNTIKFFSNCCSA